MISKELFVKTMNRLENLNKKIDKVDSSLRDLSPDFGGFYIPDIEEIVLNILREEFDDNYNDWLSYCVYELNYLRDYEDGICVDDAGEPIDLSTWEKVYDFLVFRY